MAMNNLLPEIWRGGKNWHPIREMSRLQRRMDRLFENFFNESLPSVWGSNQRMWEPLAMEEFTPACDVEETNTHFLLSFDLPGVKKDELKLEVQDNQLTVSGERKEETKGRMNRERYYGSFCRTFTLPSNVDADKMEANYENGVLQVAIPRVAVSAGKQIPIKEGKLLESKSSKAA